MSEGDCFNRSQASKDIEIFDLFVYFEIVCVSLTVYSVSDQPPFKDSAATSTSGICIGLTPPVMLTRIQLRSLLAAVKNGCGSYITNKLVQMS